MGSRIVKAEERRVVTIGNGTLVRLSAACLNRRNEAFIVDALEILLVPCNDMFDSLSLL